MGKIVLLMGESSTGKDTLKSAILKRTEFSEYGFKNIVLHTTRPIRTGEKDELRDFIIKTIEESSDKKLGRIISLIFRATSKIEEVFEQNDLFYQNTRDFYNWEYDKKEYANKNYYHPISELAMEFIKERDEERIKNSKY